MVMKGIRQRKGQFFILGAFMLCALFYMGMPKEGQLLTPVLHDLTYLSDNLEKEIPNALNLGLKENKPITSLKNFTGFADRIMLERFVNFTTLWIVTENITANDLNITAGNFLDSGNKTVSITIGATSINLTAPYNTTNSTSFGSNPGIAFNMTILFDAQNATVEWQRDKINIYVFIQMKRGDDILRKEVTG
jgi:hypothetical protein